MSSLFVDANPVIHRPLTSSAGTRGLKFGVGEDFVKLNVRLTQS